MVPRSPWEFHVLILPFGDARCDRYALIPVASLTHQDRARAAALAEIWDDRCPLAVAARVSNSVSFLFDRADHSAGKGHADDLVDVGAVDILGDRLVKDNEAAAITGRDDDPMPASPSRALVLLPVSLINPNRLVTIGVHEVSFLLWATKGDIDHILGISNADFTML